MNGDGTITQPQPTFSLFAARHEPTANPLCTRSIPTSIPPSIHIRRLLHPHAGRTPAQGCPTTDYRAIDLGQRLMHGMMDRARGKKGSETFFGPKQLGLT